MLGRRLKPDFWLSANKVDMWKSQFPVGLIAFSAVVLLGDSENFSIQRETTTIRVPIDFIFMHEVPSYGA